DKRQELVLNLTKRRVDLCFNINAGSSVSIQILLFDMTNHADYLHFYRDLFGELNRYALVDRIFVWKVQSGHIFIDNGYPGRLLVVALVKVAPLQQGDL